MNGVFCPVSCRLVVMSDGCWCLPKFLCSVLPAEALPAEALRVRGTLGDSVNPLRLC